ncbi:MAG TPA: ATP-grasp domain-containing protein [Pyrinomonadaceae bacterium]|jgi:biotin carboxylase|nr:ATP-grasp domain-containing protein [Pyrinomonadaceae bacterium]
MNVLMISPGYPTEMPYFTRGLARVGAKVLGVGDQPESDLPGETRESLTAYLRVPSLVDERAVIEQVAHWTSPITVDRVECLWEPGVLLAARLRESLGVAGMTEQEVMPFRNKDLMKQVLSDAGIRTPRHALATTAEECREAASRIGYPLILKPIDGAGSADTHRVNDPRQLEEVISKLGHLSQVNVEEFVDGEEFTFDTVCVEGEIAYYSISWYRPRPLIARTVQWISPQIIMLRDVEAEELSGGREMGRAVLKALNFRTGFTHMEWYKKADGEIVFGEIAARPPGARSVDVMNYASDVDLFTGWAEAVVHGRFTQPVERRYNAAIIFKRAQGEGYIRHVEGLERILTHFGEHVAAVNLLRVGEHRRNWLQTLLSDGHVIVRHPDLRRLMELADAVGTDLQLYAA